VEDHRRPRLQGELGAVLAPGERLFSRGDRSDGVYGVLAGAVRVSGVSLGGRETVLDFYGPGSWIGEVSTLEGQPRQHDAHAHGTTSLLQVSPDDLEALLAMHPALSRAFLRLEARRLRIVLTALEQYSVQSLEQRLANRLLMLAGPHGAASPEGVKIRLRLSQDTLAQLIGCSRQRVNQILRRWERDGVVEQRYGHITLREQVKLEKLAQS
jgi:CRP-like cAMP-binding protein